MESISPAGEKKRKRKRKRRRRRTQLGRTTRRGQEDKSRITGVRASTSHASAASYVQVLPRFVRFVGAMSRRNASSATRRCFCARICGSAAPAAPCFRRSKQIQSSTNLAARSEPRTTMIGLSPAATSVLSVMGPPP
jgi:hypothetical protein